MRKVLLVEDEKLIREGIKASLDWPGLGLEIVGEAADGAVSYTHLPIRLPVFSANNPWPGQWRIRRFFPAFQIGFF